MIIVGDEKVLMEWGVRYKGLEILEVLVSSHVACLKRDMLVLIADIILENPVDLLVRNIFILIQEYTNSLTAKAV